MCFDTCRRFNPMPMLLPCTETIQEESTSRETFSNQVIAAGTSKNSSRGSSNLDIPFVNRQCGSNISSASTSKNSNRGSINLGIPFVKGQYKRKKSSAGTSNLNQGGSIKLGIPFGHGKSGTNLTSSLESWFQLYLKVIPPSLSLSLSSAK